MSQLIGGFSNTLKKVIKFIHIWKKMQILWNIRKSKKRLTKNISNDITKYLIRIRLFFRVL